ncbi:MAG: hypothetical protein ACYCVH_00470 [Ignavibacteriaceae bacterium]
MKFIYVISIIMIFVSANSLFAQKNSVDAKIDSTVGSMAAKLQQKILLTDKQTESIKEAIIQWLNDKNNLETSSIQAKIESFLGRREKSKYSIVQKEWWSGLLKALNSISANKKLSGK